MNRLMITAGLLALTLVSGPGTASALDFFQVGFKGGVNLSRLNDEGIIRADLLANTTTDWDQQFRLGGVFGGFAQFEFSRRFLFRPEVLFTMKGEEYEPQEVGNFTLQFDYIEVPVLFIYRFPTAGSMSPGFYAGPAMSLEVSSDVKAEGPGANVISILSRTRALDVSLVLGAELVFNERYSLEARLTQGFSDIDDTGLETMISNQTLSVMAGVSFDIFNY